MFLEDGRSASYFPSLQLTAFVTKAVRGAKIYNTRDANYRFSFVRSFEREREEKSRERAFLVRAAARHYEREFEKLTLANRVPW